jgi:cytoskeletal protein CcmA (bactofilin family)
VTAVTLTNFVKGGPEHAVPANVRREYGDNGAGPAGEEFMSESPKRRLLDFLGGSPTFVAEGCRITGDVETLGPLVLCGSIYGDGHVRGALNMAATSEWEGEIRAEQGVVAGKIIGALSVTGKLEIGATAVIRARVSARSIAIAKGAVIDGELIVTSGQPVVSFEEKRRSLPGE